VKLKERTDECKENRGVRNIETLPERLEEN
jgi:hypothetical protein